MSWEQEIADDYSLSLKQVSQLRSLLEYLSGVSDRNLTSVSGEEDIVNFHFRDSLDLLAFPEFEKAENIVDVGSGAGFPGLPLAVARPDKTFSLLESTSRKCDFIDYAARLLGLGNVISLRSRAEDAARSDFRDHFDLAVARAVGPLPVVIEYVLPLLKIGGIALLQRGSREQQDEISASHAATLLGGKLEQIKQSHPYPDSKNLHIWVFSKLRPTPERFPRRTGIAKKRPLAP